LQHPPPLPTKFPAARHSIGSSLLTTSSLELKKVSQSFELPDVVSYVAWLKRNWSLVNAGTMVVSKEDVVLYVAIVLIINEPLELCWWVKKTGWGVQIEWMDDVAL
jgi:hypothetical protein